MVTAMVSLLPSLCLEMWSCDTGHTLCTHRFPTHYLFTNFSPIHSPSTHVTCIHFGHSHILHLIECLCHHFSILFIIHQSILYISILDSVILRESIFQYPITNYILLLFSSIHQNIYSPLLSQYIFNATACVSYIQHFFVHLIHYPAIPSIHLPDGL